MSELNPEQPLSYAQYKEEMIRERARHDRKRYKLEARLKAFQKTCKHKKTEFSPDPSGGNDSYYVCTICDKVID